ncbi:META domain-containing protein [Leptothermofonsia sichuanensis E412]|uniref:META domain-containing protein n=1 Tax=Leptothermofonsia sichuanensis TaxID=2917832 RepID=UPI001CA7850F|nr:META domain-containing protein [Leptothermofonsia sichuanensis]QZZ22189.1 META domain-containing protein [Leptothermofonsia sichuanensis E412]
MNSNAAFNHAFTGCIATLILGVGITSAPPVVLANPVMEQPVLQHNRLLLMTQSSVSIEGSWRLANMSESSAPTPMVPPATPALTADFSKGRITGSGGCNRFMGDYQTSADQLTIGPLASTFKACEEPILNQEFKFLKALQGAQRYEVNDDGLQIFYTTEEGSGVLRFVSQAITGLW